MSEQRADQTPDPTDEPFAQPEPAEAIDLDGPEHEPVESRILDDPEGMSVEDSVTAGDEAPLPGDETTEPTDEVAGTTDDLADTDGESSQQGEDAPSETAAPAEPAAPEEPTWRRFDVLAETSEALAAAQAAIAEGGCIVLPTDTVYGIGANAFSADAVQGLLDAKERGRDMPPPVLVAEIGMFEALGDDIPSHAMRLAQAHWPGALTLIVRAQPHLRMDLGETEGTIAVRVPDHEFTRDLLRRTGPLAVSSANVSGQPSSTDIDAAIEQLGNRVQVYLDAGATPGGTASTIVEFVSTNLGRVVRQGALSLAEIREVSPFVEGTEPDVAEGTEPDPLEGTEPDTTSEGTDLPEGTEADTASDGTDLPEGTEPGAVETEPEASEVDHPSEPATSGGATAVAKEGDA